MTAARHGQGPPPSWTRFAGERIGARSSHRCDPRRSARHLALGEQRCARCEERQTPAAVSLSPATEWVGFPCAARQAVTLVVRCRRRVARLSSAPSPKAARHPRKSDSTRQLCGPLRWAVTTRRTDSSVSVQLSELQSKHLAARAPTQAGAVLACAGQGHLAAHGGAAAAAYRHGRREPGSAAWGRRGNTQRAARGSGKRCRLGAGGEHPQFTLQDFTVRHDQRRTLNTAVADSTRSRKSGLDGGRGRCIRDGIQAQDAARRGCAGRKQPRQERQPGRTRAHWLFFCTPACSTFSTTPSAATTRTTAPAGMSKPSTRQ
jgi:hypothetical protein